MREILREYGRVMIAALCGMSIVLLIFTLPGASKEHQGLYSLLSERLSHDEITSASRAADTTMQKLSSKSAAFHPRTDLTAGSCSYPICELFKKSDGVSGGKILSHEYLNPDGSTEDLMKEHLRKSGSEVSFPKKGMYHIRASLKDENGGSYYKDFYFTVVNKKAKKEE